jgi:hypothetical protein
MGSKCRILFNVMLSVFMLDVIMLSEGRILFNVMLSVVKTECRYAKCRGALKSSQIFKQLATKKFVDNPRVFRTKKLQK